MTSLHSIIALAIMFSCACAFAKKSPSDCMHPTEIEEQADDLLEVAANMPNDGCADPSKLGGICNAVYKKWDAPQESPFEYVYEKQIHEAACVKSGDSENLIKSKVKNMWAKLEDPHLKCNQANFDVSRGSILKYSLKMSNYEFLNQAIQEWGVNLNAIDKNDGRTLLDYVNKEIERTKGSEDEKPLREYFKFLRKHGAKLKSELL